jgi:hypothetical protein
MECPLVDRYPPISFIERLAWSAFFLFTTMVAFYVAYNFDDLSSRYGTPLVAAIPIVLGLVAVRAGRDLAERMTHNSRL